MDPTERNWVDRIRNGEEEAFKEMFRAYYPKLCGFAADYVNSVDRARDIVQDVFLKIWDCRDEWVIRSSLSSYLYQAAKNRALNEIRQTESKQDAEKHLKHNTTALAQRTAEDNFHMEELSKDVEAAIAELPDRRRRAFLLHRRHGFTYKEIAQIMEIAPKTVENHIGRALKSLRKELADHLSQERE